jgi:hypothetical protein
MKKKQLFTLLSLILSIQLVAQSYVPVVFIVSDFGTNKNVNGAQVSIRQAGWATKSTGTDGKVSFDNIPVGAINFIITKDGFQLYEGEENVSSEVKNNTFRIPLTAIPTTKDKILVTGEVVDKEGKDIEGAWVEVKAANIIQNGLTDKSGNYSIEINLNTGYTVNNLAIEAKKGDCKVKMNADIPRGNVVSKDIKLDCTSESNENIEKGKTTPPPPEYVYEDNYFSIVYKDLKRQGSNLQLRLIVTAKNDDRNIQIAGGSNWENSTRLFDNNNNKYLVSTTKIANSVAEKGHNNIMSLVKDIPTELLLTFEQFPAGTTGIPLLELWFSNRPNSYGSYQLAKFRNVK